MPPTADRPRPCSNPNAAVACPTQSSNCACIREVTNSRSAIGLIAIRIHAHRIGRPNHSINPSDHGHRQDGKFLHGGAIVQPRAGNASSSQKLVPEIWRGTKAGCAITRPVPRDWGTSACREKQGRLPSDHQNQRCDSRSRLGLIR